mgnify:CR=1 FL=1
MEDMKATTTSLAQLSDEDLLHRAHHLRLQVLHGDRRAQGAAHAHEAEIRRRFGCPVPQATVDRRSC